MHKLRDPLQAELATDQATEGAGEEDGSDEEELEGSTEEPVVLV